MSIIIEIFPQCDKCGETFADYRNQNIRDEDEMIEYLIADGWHIDGHITYCPDCTKQISK